MPEREMSIEKTRFSKIRRDADVGVRKLCAMDSDKWEWVVGAALRDRGCIEVEDDQMHQGRRLVYIHHTWHVRKQTLLTGIS